MYKLPVESIDEMKIKQQMEQFREMAKNSPDPAMRNIDDSTLRKAIAMSMQTMDESFLLRQDNAIIGTGFAQFVLEGKIDDELKKLTIISIKRQLLPILIDRYDHPYRDKRKAQLTKMLDVVDKIGA